MVSPVLWFCQTGDTNVMANLVTVDTCVASFEKVGQHGQKHVQYHNITTCPNCQSPAQQAEHRSANDRPLLHWSVPFLSLSELRNEITRRRIWILVLHPRPFPFDALLHPRRSLNQSYRRCGCAHFDHPPLAMDGRLDNGIRCMVASWASKSCGVSAAIFTRSALNLSMNSQVRRRSASASLARACRSISWAVSGRHANEKIYGTSESHFVLAVASDLKRRTRVCTFKKIAWSSSTSSNFLKKKLFVSFNPGMEHGVHNRSVVQPPTHLT